MATTMTSNRERVERLWNSGQIRIEEYSTYYNPPLEDVSCIGCGDTTPLRGDIDWTDCDNLLVFSEHTGASDYSGGTLGASNCKQLVEEFGDNDGNVFTVSGAYHYDDVCFKLTWLAGPDGGAVLDILEGLEDYPVVDEEALSAHESELADEGWQSWASSDFARGIEKAFDIDDFECDDDKLRELFDECAGRANVYWENNSSGNDVSIDVGRVLLEVTVDDIKPFVPATPVRIYRDGWPFVDGTLHFDEWTVDTDLYEREFGACMAADDEELDCVEFEGHTYTWDIG